jgi:superfamily II DNA or RNA helicase
LPKSNSMTVLTRVNQTELDGLKTHYKIADEFCREVQAFSEEAGIPAMNELRYAGYHLLQALTDDSESSAEQMTKAINHCKRAAYEASEAGIITCLERINVFKQDYKAIIISETVQDWQKISLFCESSNVSIYSSRLKGKDQSTEYSVYIEKFRKLKEYCMRLDYAREELNKKIDKARTDQRQFLITIGLTILGIIIAVFFGIFPLL